MTAKKKAAKSGKGKAKASKGDFKSKLDGLDGAWEDAKNNPLQGFSTWEDGKYAGRLVGAEITESESSGRLQVVFSFQNEDVEKEDIHKKFCGLDAENNPDCLKFLRKDIEEMGYNPPENMNKLPALLEEMVSDGPVVRLQLKTKGEFQNTYINGVVEE